jgi:hypothetical protein
MGVVERASINARERTLRSSTGSEPDLEAVGTEDVREGGRDHGPEPGVLERPHGVLATGSAPEVRAGEQDRRAGELGAVQDEVGVLAPLGEQERPEPRPLDPAEVLGGHDLVGVDVRAIERDRSTRVTGEGLHRSRSSGVAK